MLINGFIRDMLAKSLAIDLGTVNTNVGISGQGIVLNEPSVIAVSSHSRNEIIAVGDDAIDMLDKTPGGISTTFPLQDGVIADSKMAEAMLRYFVNKALGKKPGMLGISSIICIPSCITEIERKALEESAQSIGARQNFILDEALAAAIGAGLPVESNIGSMVVDIGGGTTDIAVIAFNGIAVAKSVRLGGTHIDRTIMAYMQNRHGLLVGSKTAERIKIELASAISTSMNHMEVRGRHVDTGMPTSVVVGAGEISFAIKKPVREIIGAIKDTFVITPPELAGDLLETGITLTGGGSLLHGIRELIESELNLPVRLAENPMDCVINGALEVANDAALYRELFRAG